MAGRKRGAPENDELEEFNRERQAAVASRIQALDEQGAKRTLDEICARWKLDDRTMSSFQDALELALINFGLDPHKDVEAQDVGNKNLREIDGCVHSHEMELIGLYYRLRDFNLLEDPETLRRVTTCLEQVYYAKRAVLNVFQSKLSVYQLQATDAINPYELDEDLDKRLGSWSLRFRWIDDDTVPVQKLLLHMLDRAMEKRYRRQGDWCYEPVVVDGHDTHAWQPVMKIEQWLYSECQKETNWEQWQWLTMAKSTVSHVMEYLTKCQDYSFPELRKDRSTFAFANGVYRAREDKFYPHEGSTLPHTIAACKYFPIEFPTEYDRPETIPTPNLDGIMEYQEWEPAVRAWLYILLGRLLYDLNDLDGWQVIPFFCGAASSGKCHKKGTKVLMYHGTIKVVEDIVPGDLLMGDDSTPRTVLALARGSEELYDITSKYGTMTVTKEHVLCLKFSNHKSCSPWGTRGGKVFQYWDGQKFRAKKIADPVEFRKFYDAIPDDPVIEMTVAEYLELPLYIRKYLVMYHVGRLEFPNPAKPLFHPYALGAWLGDGYTNALKEIGEEHDLEWKTYSPGQYGYIRDGRVSGNKFGQVLREYNMLDNKHIPHELLTASVEDRLELLAGILDTDGYKKPLGGSGYEVTQKVEAVADGIQFLAMSLGFGVTKKAVQKSCTKKTGTYYRVNIFGDGIEDIPCRIAKKVAKRGVRKRNALVYGFDVKLVPGAQPYYGFQTDGNQRFVLADGTVTHNSTITLKVAKMFYEDIDVGNLSNNIETKFGLSQFYDKLLFVAPEIKADLKIEQAEFQSIVSGEDITINEKHKTAFSVTWKTPGVLAGNEVPNWCDNAGSIQRRILLFDFPKQVVNGDMQLSDKLEAEIAHILLKCNKMYLEAARKWSAANVWTVLPAYFTRTRDAIAASTNVVEAFLSSSDVMLKPGHEIYMEDFKTALKTFAKQNNFTVKRFTGEFFRGPFQKFGVKMERRFEEVDGKTRAVDYLSGVELVAVTNSNAMG